MATQFASIAPIPFPAPRSVRIAYSASPAAIAVRDKLVDLPEHKRDATLEELAVIALADEVVAQARDVLSPSMFEAFLGWAEAATLVETEHGRDDDAPNDKVDDLDTAFAAIKATRSVNHHDIGLKTYVSLIEHGDCPSFGPVAKTPAGYPGRQLGLIDDLLRMSPLLGPLNQLAETAWSFSPPAAFADNIGRAIAARFTAARSSGDAATSVAATNSAAHAGSQWDVLAAVYHAALAVENAYEQQFCLIDNALPVGLERSAAIDSVPVHHWAEIERLAQLRIDAEQKLLNCPSPTASAFALKVLVCRGGGREFNAIDELLEREAKRFADVDPAAAWSRGLATYEAALAAYDVHYRDVLLPADARYNEGTAQWPAGYDFAADPVAKAARDAVDYRDVEDHSNELVSAYVDAMRKLLMLPGRSVADLATKLEILKREEGSTLTDIDDIVGQLAADARAIAGGISASEVK